MRFALCVLCFGVSVALAAPSGEADKLFQEGLALFDKGEYDAACAKFEESLGKDPGALGTLMNLGRCNEKRGKLVTALAAYQQALERATAAKAAGARDKAQERITALTAQIPVVTLARKTPPLAGEQLTVDTKPVPPEQTELRLDPGRHALALTAPDRLPFQKELDLAAGAKITIELPELQPPAKPTVVTPVAKKSSRTKLGRIATFGGAGLVVLGGVLAVYAKLEYDKQFDDPDGDGPLAANCSTVDGAKACNATGQSKTDSARSIGTAATVVGAVGVAAAATGIVLWITAPKESANRQARIVPTGGPTHAGLAIVGRF